MTDLRKYTRLPLDIIVEIYLADGTRLYGETADVSLDGAFVILTPPPGIETGQPCTLELIIKTEEGWVRVSFECTIAHIKNDGIGLQFNSADTPHHESFLKLLIDGSNDVDKLLEELSHHPRKDFQFSSS
ncbi:MAG: PilZ domain-containing protein [Ectothiorhodospiraceae bacterium]|nr:PilZ domain-containing protein [Ectothiorhodospiraceae bacterium]